MMIIRLLSFSFLLISIGLQAQIPQYFQNLHNSKQSSTPFVKWTNFGPGMSGYCDELFTHPTDPNAMYMSLDMNNMYYTHDGAQQWTTMKDWDTDGEGKRPTWMDYSRQDPDFGFALDEKGNLLKTTNRGKSWTQTRSFGRKHSVITVDPNNDNNWYIGAGQFWRVKFIHRSANKPHGTQYRNTEYGHIYISKDKGESWTKITNNFNANLDVAKIFVDPNNSNRVYAYTNYGFYKSTNGGTTWTKKGSGLPFNEPRDGDMYFDNTTGEFKLYLLEQTHYKDDNNGSVTSSGGVYRSDDNGETWQAMTGNLAFDMTKINSYGNREKYYRALAQWFSISTAQAKSRFNKLPSSVFTVFNRIVVSKNDPDVVFISHNTKHDYSFGPGDIWRTTNGGNTWITVGRQGKYWAKETDKAYWLSRNNPIGMNMHYAHMQHELVNYDILPGTRMMTMNSNGDLFIVHEQQILRSNDNGDSWFQVDDTETSPGSGHWVGRGGSNLPGQNLYLESSMTRKLFCSGEHGLWIEAPGGDKVQKGHVAVEQLTGQSKKSHDATSICEVAVHPTDTNKIYIMMFRQSERGRLRRSTDGGATWANISYPCKSNTPLSPEENKIFQYDLQFDQDNPDNMFFCVPYTRWVAYKSTLWERNGPSDFNEFGVYKSTDGGFNWNLANSGLPATSSVAHLEMDPQNSKTMYAALNKVNIDGQPKSNGGLYKTTNGGNQWNKVTIPMEIEGLNHVHIDRTNGYLYISAGEFKGEINKGGVWRSKNGGNSWQKIFHMPHVRECHSSNVNPDVLLVNVGRAQKISLRNPGVYFSKDQGVSWTKANYELGQPSRIMALQPDPKDENVFYAALYGSGFYRGVLMNNDVRAVASNVYVNEGEIAQLDGSSSIGSNLDFLWSAQGIPISNNSNAIANFTAPAVTKDSTFKIKFRASDNNSSDETEILVHIQNTGTVITPTPQILFHELPQSTIPTSTLSVDVTYEVHSEQQVSVVFSSPAGAYITNSKQIVQPGSETITILLNFPTELLIADDYQISCDIRPVGGNWNSAIVREEQTIDVIIEEFIDFTLTPTVYQQSQSLPVEVSYSTSEPRDLYAIFFSPSGQWLGNGRTSVPAESGSTTIMMNLAAMPDIIDDYMVKIVMRPFGGANTENLKEQETLVDIAEVLSSESQIDDQVSIYPNPTTETLSIAHGSEHEKWSIVNFSGQLIQSGKGQRINTGHLPKGAYFLHLKDNSIPFIKN